MSLITLIYTAQAKAAAGCGTETIETDAATVSDLIRQLAARSAQMDTVLTGGSGTAHPSLLVFRDGDQLSTEDFSTTPLRTGSEITIMSPIAGG